MATVPHIRLVAAVDVAGAVAVPLLGVVALCRVTGAPVVGREDHQRVLGHALGVERVEDLADAGVGLDAEVASQVYQDKVFVVLLPALDMSQRVSDFALDRTI